MAEGGYSYADESQSHTHAYLWPSLRQAIAGRSWPANKRSFDLGCGNGFTAKILSDEGFDVVGVDPSEIGIGIARKAYPNIRCEIGSAYDDLASQYGQFDLVVSLEVVEHCMEPRRFAKTLMNLIAPGGMAFVSTPYHGYLKNVALAVTGKMDSHFTALWDGGHIKFWSIRTLGDLLREAGARNIEFQRVGRFPALAKSMVAIVRDQP